MDFPLETKILALIFNRYIITSVSRFHINEI